MISYRAETSMVGILREKMACTDDARALLRQISDTECERTIKSYVTSAISSTKLRRFSRTPNSGDSSGSGGQSLGLTLGPGCPVKPYLEIDPKRLIGGQTGLEE